MTVQRVAREEIRFAVVLNGGVSLAVWMGGAVAELDRLTRGRDEYGELLTVLSSTARTDVITGTSAGGINGAALALAQANENADLAMLRDMWAEQGRMETLLRSPFSGSPPSLLKGDDHFLPQLATAMRGLAVPFMPRGTAESFPVDLTIKTTLLRGAKDVTVDAMGQQLPQSIHEASFRFVRSDREKPDGEGMPRDDFAADRIEETAQRLALAARSTASFPVAFEPSFVPVGNGAATSAPRKGAAEFVRPDMSDVVSWGRTGPDGAPMDTSRFAVDGGLLANTPTRDALSAVGRMPGGGPVRRVMLLVYPHAPSDLADRPDDAAAMPSLVETSTGLLTAMSSQGSRTFVDEVEQHNRRALGHRTERNDIIAEVEGSPGQLRHLAGDLLPHYRTMRRRRAGRSLAPKVPSQQGWSLDRIRAAASAAQDEWPGELPYVAAALPSEDGAPAQWQWGEMGAVGVLAAAADLLKRLSDVVPGEEVERLVDRRRKLDELRLQVRDDFARFDRSWAHPALKQVEPGRSYWLLRLAAFENVMLGTADLGDLRKYRDDALVGVEGNAHDGPRDVIDQIVGIASAGSKHEESTAGRLGERIMGAVGEGIDAVTDVLDLLADDQIASMGELLAWRTLLPAGSSRDVVLARLLCLEIVTSTLSPEPPRENDYPVELVQLSLQTRNAFAHYTTGEDKVGGAAIMRFSGFLKRSWRVNDWTWGRLDAATMLCQVLLKPSRLRRIAELTGTLTADEAAAKKVANGFVDDLCQRLFATTTPGEIDNSLASLRDEAVMELQTVYTAGAPTAELPAMLPKLAALAAWALHLRIVAEELPAIAAAIRVDQQEGAGRSSRGAVFLAEHSALLAELEQLGRSGAKPARDGPDRAAPEAADAGSSRSTAPEDAETVAARLRLGWQALAALDRAGIGREPLREEGMSDQMIRTAATAAGAAVTFADSDHSGLGAVKTLTRTLRGGALLPYWTINGLTRGGSTARFFALLALAFGGTLLALALFGMLPEWAAGPGAAVGVGALLGAFGYAAVRTGSLVHGIVLLSPIIPLVTYALTAAQDSADRAMSAAQGGAVVLVVLGLVLGLIVLGSLPATPQSPLATLYNALDRLTMRLDDSDPPREPSGWTRVAAAVIIVLVAAAAVAAGWAVARFVPILIDLSPDLASAVRSRPAGSLAAAVVALAAGIALAYGFGRSLRMWRPRLPRQDHPSSGQDEATEWVAVRVTHPAGTTAGWSIVYGAAFVGIGAALIAVDVNFTEWAWARAALATCVLAAAVLFVVVPAAVPLLARRHLRKRLIREVGVVVPPRAAEQDIRKALLTRLQAHGLTYAYLCAPANRRARTGALTPRKPARRIEQAIANRAREGAAQPTR